MGLRTRQVLIGVSVLVGAVGTHAAPSTPRYTFARIADTKGEFRYVSMPAINNRGDVVFVADCWGGGRAVVTGNERGLALIADTRTGPFEEFVNVGSINERGQVAFGSYREGDGGADVVWLWDAGRLWKIADTTDGRFLYARGSPIINNSGAVAFWVRLADTTDAIMIWERGALRQAVGGGAFTTLDAAPAFTNAGALAFKAQFAGSGLDAIVVADRHGWQIVSDSTGPFHHFSPAPGLNAAGAVVFQADGGVHLMDGRSAGDVATTGTVFSDAARPTINAAGTVAFAGRALVSARGLEYAVFTGPDAVTDRVIAGNDVLDGERVESVDFFRGLNDRGSIAFVAHFLTWSAVYRADRQ